MKKEARVLIVEDDPFALNWMALLLARDWRTCVVGVTNRLDGMRAAMNREGEKPNFILLNADLLAGAHEWAGLASSQR